MAAAAIERNRAFESRTTKFAGGRNGGKNWLYYETFRGVRNIPAAMIRMRADDRSSDRRELVILCQPTSGEVALYLAGSKGFQELLNDLV